MANFETLLSPSGILLYGRQLLDLQFVYNAPPSSEQQGDVAGIPPRLGENRFLQRQMAQPDALFARIYGFSFEGHYYDLPKPVILLVHGEGMDAEGPLPGDSQAMRRIARTSPDTDRTGVASEVASFPDDMKVWAYDMADLSIRLDVETGPFEQILLEAEVRPDAARSYYSGADLRIKSGADLRIRSGADMRIRGKRGSSD